MTHVVTETPEGAECSCGRTFAASQRSNRQGSLNLARSNAYRHANSHNKKGES